MIHEHPFKTRRPIAFELDQQRCNEQLKEKIEKTENELREKHYELETVKERAASECYFADDLSGDLCGVNPCLKNPCLNNGTCIPEGGANFKCICPKFFKGTKCEVSFFLYRQP